MTSTKMYLSVLLFLILVIPVVSGSISVQNIAITPSGDLISGQSPPQKVSISYGINFIPSGGVTFSDSDTLGMSTDLDNAHWNYTIILDGNPNTPQIAQWQKTGSIRMGLIVSLQEGPVHEGYSYRGCTGRTLQPSQRSFST